MSIQSHNKNYLKESYPQVKQREISTLAVPLSFGCDYLFSYIFSITSHTYQQSEPIAQSGNIAQIQQHYCQFGQFEIQNNPTMHYDNSNNTFLVWSI